MTDHPRGDLIDAILSLLAGGDRDAADLLAGYSDDDLADLLGGDD